eukprot:TRINITY_DN16411_c1_g1_i1.p1 TRINITY_DN16411_c1_g1~~TRINITY_DN16411_c1_g1_i1.p1  ORF type:complete len:333 (+),score=93.24 TRINITY_DN16411_c1_g1_i1:97-999(+)
MEADGAGARPFTMRDFVRQRQQLPLQTYVPVLDECGRCKEPGLQSGDVVAVCGPPDSGKTQVAVAGALGAAPSGGVLFFDCTGAAAALAGVSAGRSMAQDPASADSLRRVLFHHPCSLTELSSWLSSLALDPVLPGGGAVRLVLIDGVGDTTFSGDASAADWSAFAQGLGSLSSADGVSVVVTVGAQGAVPHEVRQHVSCGTLPEAWAPGPPMLRAAVARCRPCAVVSLAAAPPPPLAAALAAAAASPGLQYAPRGRWAARWPDPGAVEDPRRAAGQALQWVPFTIANAGPDFALAPQSP